MSNIILSCDNLSKKYDDLQVVKNITLHCTQGELLAIGGKSGSGKSTLLSLLSGLEYADAGEVHLSGQALSKMSENELALLRRDKVGFVFQSFNLIPTLTALENVEFPLFPIKRAHKDMRSKATELLKIVGLQDRMTHLPTKLSGGEKQRVAIARALINSPEIVFADEPTGNLDTTNGEEIFQLIRRLNQEMGITFLLVTHDENLIGKADRVVRLADGQLAG